MPTYLHTESYDTHLTYTHKRTATHKQPHKHLIFAYIIIMRILILQEACVKNRDKMIKQNPKNANNVSLNAQKNALKGK